MLRRGFAYGMIPLLLACATSAQAAEGNEEKPSTATGEEWQFSLIAYAWAAGAQGTTDLIGPAEPVGLDLSFGDVLKALKFVLMGAAEAQHGRFVAVGDFTFIHLDASHGIDIRDQDFLDAELDTRTTELTLLGGYRIVDKEKLNIDLLAGGRMNWFKATLELDGPVNSAEGSEKKSWFDPVVAARVGAPLGDRWRMALYGDIGGIVTGSDVSWQTVATVDYQIDHKMSVGGGWRAFKVHYEDGDFLYDVAQSGPLLTFRTSL